LLMNTDDTCDFRILVKCSSGTYVRTLANDIGDRLGLGGHLIELRRTEVGHFVLAGALTLSELENMKLSDNHIGDVVSLTACDYR
jgi:tRNA pseudouridine55 synthase